MYALVESLLTKFGFGGGRGGNFLYIRLEMNHAHPTFPPPLPDIEPSTFGFCFLRTHCAHFSLLTAILFISGRLFTHGQPLLLCIRPPRHLIPAYGGGG